MKKAGKILFCFVPFILTLALQVVVMIPTYAFSLMHTIQSGSNGNINSLLDNIASISTEPTFLVASTFIYAIANIIVFFFWYRAVLRKQNIYRRTPFSIAKSLLPGILLSFGLYFIIIYFMQVLSYLFPSWMDIYSDILHNSGLNDPFSMNTASAVMLILYAVILGPISEELVFRGVILSLAKKQMPFFVANIFQAALFGLLHLNPLQGSYAFIVGLVFGYIAHNRGTIKATIMLHIIYNFIGMFVASLLPSSDSWAVYVHMLVLAASIIATIFGLLWYRRTE